MVNWKWLFLAIISCTALFATGGCDCNGDDDDNDDDHHDNDTGSSTDDDTSGDDDTDGSNCGLWEFQCFALLLGACVDVYHETDVYKCSDHCVELDSQAILVNDKYCVCCEMPWS